MQKLSAIRQTMPDGPKGRALRRTLQVPVFQRICEGPKAGPKKKGVLRQKRKTPCSIRLGPCGRKAFRTGPFKGQ